MKTPIFVYGTLKSEQRNSYYCRNAISIEKATICGKLYQLSAGYPALQVPQESILSKDFQIHNDWEIVYGELITFANTNEIKPIDRLEGVPHYYQRVLISVRKSDGSVIAAWVYIMHEIPKSSRYLPNGNWPAISKLEPANEN